MDELLRALGKALDDLVARGQMTGLEIRYDRRYADEPWEIGVTTGDGPMTGEGRTAEEAATRVAQES
ncbi:MAG: hypothetical protein ACYC5Y_05150 [Symbiobacteriia bacterium]